MWSLIQNWFLSLLSDLEKESTEPRFRWRWVLVPGAVLLVITILVRVTGFDLAAQEGIYRAGGDSWSFGDHPFWKSLYHLGTIPTTLVVLASLVGFFLSWSKDAFRRWRRVFIYLVLTGVVGPGIITNAILKEYWGRPRPREVEGLGGHNLFEPILSIDLSSFGKSFPCGHATMGFYFLCGFFLLRRHRKSLADGILVGAVVLGGFMGIARMLQGAHFFSDVVWAGAVCWFSAMGLFYAMRLDRGLVQRGLSRRKMPLKTKIVAFASLAFVLGGILLASPYHSVRKFYIVGEEAKSGVINVRLRLEAGEVEIVPGEKLRIEGEAYGHGLPTSGIVPNFVESKLGQFPAVAYVERRSGFLTEVNQQLTVTLPWERINRLRIENMGAKVWIRGGEPQPNGMIQLAEGQGGVTFLPDDFGKWRIEKTGDPTITGEEYLKRKEGAPFSLIIEREFEGHLAIEPKDR